jgi:phosphoglycerol transferase MdoB-like AlkP superfamily enzyme
MKFVILSVVKQFVFWLLFFALLRFVFIFYHFNVIHSESISAFEILKCFWFAFPLDLSTAAYIMIIPLFLLLIQSLFSPMWVNYINKSYTFIVILIFSVINAAELGIYDEWKTKLTSKALKYMRHPGEIYNSAQTGTFILLLLILTALTVLSFYIYRRYFYRNLFHVKRNYIFSLLFLLLSPGLLLIGLRGGLQPIPIQQSQCYYSHHTFMNLAATNSGYNLGHSFFENKKYLNENPYRSFSSLKAKEIVNNLFVMPKDTTLQVLKTSRPNIVLIILESWSGDLIHSLGGLEGITPNFEKLEKEGILFNSFYANGTRSEQGMAAIFGGLPGHPISSLTDQPDKYHGLPSIVHSLNKEGYKTSFYFGGQLIYGNIKSYIYYNAFDRITEQKDFTGNEIKGKLGVHDPYVLKRQLREISFDKEPFFSAIFTLSTHSPFDMPMKIKDFWDNRERMNLYLNSAYYTDSCIGSFIEAAKKEKWYKNTLFIFIADHSHPSYKQRSFHSAEYHKIFLLLSGDVIKDEYKGIKISTIGSQVDLVAVLFSQLGMKYNEFRWSKNLLNPYCPGFASVGFEEGIGWIRPAGNFFYDKRLNIFHNMEIAPEYRDSLITEGKAYLQLVFQQYLDQ